MTNRIPILIHFTSYGQPTKGFLTEHVVKDAGKEEKYRVPNWWWLHNTGDLWGSGSCLVDTLLFQNGELYWKSGRAEMTAQIEVFREVLIAWYQ